MRINLISYNEKCRDRENTTIVLQIFHVVFQINIFKCIYKHKHVGKKGIDTELEEGKTSTYYIVIIYFIENLRSTYDEKI